jgi:antitoxin component of RelBE/YafQ-DinJ toxin-antitoxin module
MTNEDYKPRFSFEIDEDIKKRADLLLGQYGIRRSVMTVILNDFLDLIEQHGQIVVGVLLEKAAKPREIIKSLAEAERRGKK